MTPVMQKSRLAAKNSPRVLIVDDEADLIDPVGDAVGRELDCKLSTAKSVAEAQKILQTQEIDLLVTDLNFPDGLGTDLLSSLRKRHPLASAIVITGAPSLDGAVDCLRKGAVDFLAKPFTVPEFLKRIRGALHRQSLVLKNENRIDRLRDAVRRLNEARKLVSKKVDLLCNDLVSAYGDLSRQLERCADQRILPRRTFIVRRNLEQMLCHAMDWLLRQMGYSNVAIWLAGDDAEYQLGAYMKYTIPGDQDLIDAMRDGISAKLVNAGLIHWNKSQAAEQLTPAESKILKDQTVLGVHCTYLGESLAQIIMFRDGNQPFSDDDASTLRTISAVFALTLATMVRNQDDPDGEETDGNPFYDGGAIMDQEENADDDDGPPPQKKPRKNKKDDEADWWKRGETPPF